MVAAVAANIAVVAPKIKQIVNIFLLLESSG